MLVLGCMATAAIIAAVLWCTQLAQASYRRSEDQPRCSARRSWIVIPVAALFGAGAGLVPAGGLSWVFAGLAGLMTVLAWIDLDVFRIPNQFVGWGGAVLVFAGSMVTVLDRGWAAVAWAAGVGLALGVLLGGFALFTDGVGMGDAKLVLVLAWVLACWHPGMAVMGCWLGLVIGAITAGVQKARRRGSVQIAMGICFLVGALAAVGGEVVAVSGL